MFFNNNGGRSSMAERYLVKVVVGSSNLLVYPIRSLAQWLSGRFGTVRAEFDSLISDKSFYGATGRRNKLKPCKVQVQILLEVHNVGESNGETGDS